VFLVCSTRRLALDAKGAFSLARSPEAAVKLPAVLDSPVRGKPFFRTSWDDASFPPFFFHMVLQKVATSLPPPPPPLPTSVRSERTRFFDAIGGVRSACEALSLTSIGPGPRCLLDGKIVLSLFWIVGGSLSLQGSPSSRRLRKIALPCRLY